MDRNLASRHEVTAPTAKMYIHNGNKKNKWDLKNPFVKASS